MTAQGLHYSSFGQDYSRYLTLIREKVTSSKEGVRELADRISYIFLQNLQHLIPVGIAVASCFIPTLIPGVPLSTGVIAAAGALSTSLSYFSYQVMQYWNIYPYDYIIKVEPSEEIVVRQNILEKIQFHLTKPQHNNVFITGKPGVGKTSISQSLASWLKDKEVYYLDLDEMKAGPIMPGVFHKRFKGILDVLENRKDIVLFVDEAHQLMNTTDGSSLSQMLKKPLEKGLRLICATSEDKFSSIKEDPAFQDRFEEISLEEPSEQECIEILQKRFPKMKSDTALYAIEKSLDLLKIKIRGDEAPFNDPSWHGNPRRAIKFLANERHLSKKDTPIPTRESIDRTFAFLS
ncbi:AAA family ATPase [Chlamydiales bacterium]|nr:AAA family ATPase [Chlamydiales bacterium]